ncbi:formimidoylglutamase [Tamlana fucoidanivorans]|uniref:Formimidoylglutamase n=1 Tax=Allotamlana fucoidanivorans TaxID=2583814 RepID=A0A5C4SRB7_9FLAO|nr:formimidoylglutamase [Tamlana fucoidanivorans]TNJ46540.1 formimidoylglutamase [Tamlana fucoidanivorans]
MDKLVLFNRKTCNSLLKKRTGESKFGQHIQTLTSISNIYEQLENLDVTYVILGLPEDVGVFANHGKTGASKTWEAFITTLLNIQSNRFYNANRILLLGHLDFSEEQDQMAKLNQSRKKDVLKSRKIVEQIDKQVTHIIYQIVLAGKTPIIIGGGHNNAYGNIKGTSLAYGKPINAINFDAHTDFRAEEGRHSGNGFSYALSEGFLNKYFVFGLHENYTSDQILDTFENSENLDYNTYEALEVKNELKFKKELKRASAFVSENKFGLEIDCDAIENIPSSALTPSGFSVNKVRYFVNYFAKNEHVAYLHICEGIANKKKSNHVAKLITYLVTDFIKER